MRTAILTQRKHFLSWFMSALIAVAVLGLAGCGGGGSSSSTSTGGTSTLAGSAGQITGFGSIIVNGERIHTGGAELEFEDGTTVTLTDTNNEAHLSLGMEVEVEGSVDDNGTRTASRVSVDSSLDGPLAGLSQAGDVFSFSILGQSVVAVRGMTIVDDTVLLGNLDNLADGMVIEVHGQPDENGVTQASFIEWKANTVGDLPLGFLFELTGNATSLTGSTFMIGSQLVDYTGVTPRDGVLSEGILVEVKGTLNGSTFEAVDVEVKNGFDDLPEFEVEGLLTALDTGLQTFMVRGQLVDYSNAMFMGGLEEDLLNGLRVEAEGPIINGVLIAEKVKFKDNFRYKGPADLVGNVLTISNPNLGGVDLIVTIDSSLTRDETTGAGSPFKVRARQVEGSNLLATRIKDNDGNADRQIFQAQVVAINGPLVEILNGGMGSGLIVIDTDDIIPDDSTMETNFEIEDAQVSRQDFFIALQVGDIVEARWNMTDNRWDEIEIELDD